MSAGNLEIQLGFKPGTLRMLSHWTNSRRSEASLLIATHLPTLAVFLPHTVPTVKCH